MGVAGVEEGDRNDSWLVAGGTTGVEEGDRNASWLVAGGATGCGCACDEGKESADEGVDWTAGAVGESGGVEEGESE